jgi:hydroxylamine reductase
VHLSNTSNRRKRIPHKNGEDMMAKWACLACDYVYDEEKGDPDNGIDPGTLFEDIPDDWLCPVCFVGKNMFERISE